MARVKIRVRARILKRESGILSDVHNTHELYESSALIIQCKCSPNNACLASYFTNKVSILFRSRILFYNRTLVRLQSQTLWLKLSIKLHESRLFNNRLNISNLRNARFKEKLVTASRSWILFESSHLIAISRSWGCINSIPRSVTERQVSCERTPSVLTLMYTHVYICSLGVYSRVRVQIRVHKRVQDHILLTRLNAPASCKYSRADLRTYSGEREEKKEQMRTGYKYSHWAGHCAPWTAYRRFFKVIM